MLLDGFAMDAGHTATETREPDFPTVLMEALTKAENARDRSGLSSLLSEWARELDGMLAADGRPVRARYDDLVANLAAFEMEYGEGSALDPDNDTVRWLARHGIIEKAIIERSEAARHAWTTQTKT